MDKLLTVTIPAYNAEKFLAPCLESLLSCGRRGRTELLVVDDGSRDRTGAIADAYAGRYPGIVRVIHKENGGHGSGINAGIAAATGRYFRVVDSDDTVDPGAYGTYLERLEDIDSDLVVTPFVCVEAAGAGRPREGRAVRGHGGRSTGGNGGRAGRHRARAGGQAPRQVQGAEGLPRGRALPFGKVAGRMHVRMHEWTVRTSILKEHSIRMSERCFYVDMQYILFPVPWIRTCCILDLPVYRYRLGDGGQSVSVRNMRENRGQHRKVMHSLVEFYKERERAGDPAGRLAYLARGIAKMEANQVQAALSLPVGGAAKRELLGTERWIRRDCPAAYAANEKWGLWVLRGSRYALYPLAAAAWRAMQYGRAR